MKYLAYNILYGALCLFPFMFFAYYPLRYFKRFSGKIMFALEAAISIPEILIFLLALHVSSKYIAIFAAIIIAFNILAYKLLYKINIGRILFNLLLIVNVANFTVIFAKFLTMLFFRNTVDINFYWTDSVCILITELVFVLPMFLFIKHFSDSIIRNNSFDYVWRIAWIVPLILSIFGVVLIYTPNILASSKIELYAKKSVICAMIVLCILMIYLFIAKLINTQYGILKLEKDLYNTSIQQLQYHKIEQQIKDTRIIRHDLKHHIVVMRNYIEQNKYDELKQYLNQYSQSIDTVSRLHYTDNSILNTILVYYADMCRSNHINFDANIALPNTLCLKENENTIIFGNLLENAYHACVEMNENIQRQINVRACIKSNTILLLIENSYGNNLKQDGIGNYVTTKSNGSGIGIRSVKEIVAKYDGFITIKTSDSIFNVSISIPNK